MTIVGGYRKYKEISFLRGFSITTVVLMHLLQVFVAYGEIPHLLRLAASLGGTGGHVFVFCSGFGLYLSYLRTPIGVGIFFKKRFLKIYIPYIIFIIIEFFLPHTADQSILIKQLLSHIFLYKMFFEKYIISYGLQFWFISAIIQLYLLFLPLCILRKKISMHGLAIVGVVISISWWVMMEYTGFSAKRIWGSFCLQYLWEFILGMAAAEFFYSRDKVNIPLWVLWCTSVIGLSLQAILAIKGGWFAVFNDIPALFGYGSAALLLWFYGKQVLRPLFLWIDGFSYEWYLVHITVFARFYGSIRQYLSSELLLALLAMLISIAVAWLYSKLIRYFVKML